VLPERESGLHREIKEAGWLDRIGGLPRPTDLDFDFLLGGEERTATLSSKLTLIRWDRRQIVRRFRWAGK
jgi:hypothetical protein